MYLFMYQVVMFNPLSVYTSRYYPQCLLYYSFTSPSIAFI